MATSSQRISFTHLVLDMGLADKKGLLKAKKLIKERKADGKKLTVARACVELGILTEKQAKKVQRELKRLKEGLAQSGEFTVPEAPDEPSTEAKARKKAKKADDAGEDEAKQDEAKKAKKAEAKKAEAKKAEAKKAKAKKAKKAEADEADEDAPKKPKARARKEAKPSKEADEDDDEDEAPKGKRGAVAKKAPTRKFGKKPGATRGKPGAVAKRGPAGRKRGREADAAGEEDGPRKPSKTPFLIVGAAVALLLAIAFAFAFSGDNGKPQVAQGDPVLDEPGADVVEPTSDEPGAAEDPSTSTTPPKPGLSAEDKKLQAMRQVDRLVMDADDKAYAGKFSEAIALLESFPQELRDQPAWVEDGEPLLAKYRQLLPVQERCEDALAKNEAGDAEPLKGLIKEFRDDAFKLKSEPFVKKFLETAAEAMGEETYIAYVNELDAATAAESIDEFEFEANTDEEVELLTAHAAEVRTRGTEERRASFKAKLPAWKANLEKARERFAADVAAERDRIKAHEKKAIKASKKAKLTTDDGKSCKLTGFTDRGFTIQVGGEEATYGWGNCPPKLGHSVKQLAIDIDNGQQVYELGIYALTRALFDVAQRDFERAVRLDGSLKDRIPDVEQFKPFTQLFRGLNRRGAPGSETSVHWKFSADRPQEARDFKPLHQMMKVELTGGQLKVSSPPMFLVTAAGVQGAWSNSARITAVPASNNPPPLIAVQSQGGAFAVILGQKTQLFNGFTGDGEALAESEIRAMPGTQVELACQVHGEKATLVVKLDGQEVFSHEVPFQGEIKFNVGAKGSGEARFDEIKVAGVLSEPWAQRTLAAAPNLIARQLREMNRQRTAQTGKAPVIPVAYTETSAEDEVALEGIPADLVKMLKDGRTLLEQGNEYAATEKFREAAERNIEFHAANYLYASTQTRSDPQGALIRLKRCVKGVEDFYEAEVAEAEALFWMGRYEQSRKVLDKALATRPDYAPAHLMDANLSVAVQKYEEALDKLKLAKILGPGDPIIETYLGQVTALAEGPSWPNRARFSNEFYRLDTDMISFGPTFLKLLTLVRTAIAQQFPMLVNPEAPSRQASILVFSEAEGYYQYSERTGVGRAEDSLGHFNTWSGQLLLFLESEPKDWNAFHVIFHEGTHQWCNSQGLALPFWANEGLAEFMGGTELALDGSRIIATGKVSSFLKQRLQGLTANWDQREKTWLDIMKQSPQEFYSGATSLKYGQAWTIVHFIMQSGDEQLKKTFFDYLQHFVEIAKGDAADKKEAQGSTKLEHVYVDTFHQLDMKAIEAKWEKWVEKLANDAGIPWKLPTDEKGGE